MGYRIEYGKKGGGATTITLGYVGSQNNPFSYHSFWLKLKTNENRKIDGCIKKVTIRKIDGSIKKVTI